MVGIILCSLIIILVASFLRYWWVFLLLFIFSIVLAIVLSIRKVKCAERVVSASVIYEMPIFKTDTVKTGYSSGFSWTSSNVYHTDHYEYRNVLEGYKVHFAVTYKDGRCGLITCKKDDRVYNILINKT